MPDWYLGGMTAGGGRELALPFGFLGEGSLRADSYLDRPEGGPTALTGRDQSISSTEALRVAIPPSGGFAARLTRVAR